MHMAARPHRWTRADLDRLPDDGNRYEVIDGALFVSPPPTLGHERLHERLGQDLRPYIDQYRLGELFQGHHAVILGENHVEPDLTVFPLTSPRAVDWQDLPKPILVVEVLSRTSMRRDQIVKRSLYQREAIPDYWIVDGEARQVHVTTPTEQRVEPETLRWHPTGAPVALEIDLRRLFEDALG